MKKGQIAAANFSASARQLAVELADAWEVSNAKEDDYWSSSNMGEYVLAREAGHELWLASEQLLPSLTKMEVIALLHLVEWGNPIEHRWYKKLAEEEILPYL